MLDEDGAALVEATLVLPLLLLLVVALAETSLFLWTSGLAVKAVQLGVRRAVVSRPVALGPGLDVGDEATVWAGVPLGLRCSDGEPGVTRCPGFLVRCTRSNGCVCPAGGLCGFRFSEVRLGPILDAMRAVLPELRPEEVEVSYATNGFGYGGRPGPVPVDVEIRLVGFGYRPLFFGDWLGRLVAIPAAARQPGEALGGNW